MHATTNEKEGTRYLTIHDASIVVVVVGVRLYS